MNRDARHGRDWEDLATLDPLWAILSDAGRQFGKWPLGEFFRTGEEEVERLMLKAADLGLPRARRRAIDFGCGVGRLTRALHAYFPECQGVDISSSMVEAAGRLNPACHFRQGQDLSAFIDGYADLVYSSLVLQHQPDRRRVMRIVADMLRVLAPGGLLVFQMPMPLLWRSRLQLRRRAYGMLRALGLPHTYLYRRLNLNPVRLIGLPQRTVEAMVSEEGGRLLRVEHSGAYGKEFMSGIYFCSKDV